MQTKRFGAYCLDLDGTVYKGSDSIPEAISFVAKLQKQGLEPYFVTNNSSLTPLQVQHKLASFGMKMEADNVMTSAIAAAKYCRENFRDATVMMIGERGLEEALELEGIEINHENPDIVIMGIDRHINYAKLADASLAIRAGAHFIATNSDKAIPTERGLVPGNGSFVKLVENATGEKPIFIGKPEPHMLSLIQSIGGYDKSEMVMIGDNYDTDILAGVHFGIDTIHVAGGVTSPNELKSKDIQPTFIVDTLLDWEL